MKRLPQSIKRRNTKKAEEKPPEFGRVLPSAISAIKQNLDEHVEIAEVYIVLKNDGLFLTYQYRIE